MSNVQSYNALIDRFKAFASGHFILKTFSHGQIDTADLEKFTEYPFMHVVPSNVTYAKGTKTFSFQIVLADLPRDKDDKVEFQREVLSDLQRIAEDLVAEITNHRVLFGDLITVQNVSLEPFLEEFHNTLTGWTVSLELLVPYYWDACSIPAEWNDMFESGSGGTGSILTFIDSITRDEYGNVSLVNDEATPAPNYYYGTNDEGVRGWYLLTDEVGLTCATIGSCQTIIDIEAEIDLLQQDVTDLQADVADIETELPNKVPYTGATGDVNLGEFGVQLGNLEFDVTPTNIPTAQGSVYWDDNAETLALIMNGTTQKVGEDTFYHVRNTTGSTIPKGTPVRFAGTTGNSGRLLIAPMIANGTTPSQYYMGVTSEEILNNQDGKVYQFGKMRGVNTSAFADGDILYVSTTVAGGFQTTQPTAPNNIIVAAAVVHAANNGTLMIRQTLGSNINADEGVLITTPVNNNVLTYESSTSLWKNKTVETALGFTPVPTTRTLTINGTTQDLSANRTFTIATGLTVGTTPITSGTVGRVLFEGTGNVLQESANFFWDNTNGRLGIGTTTPTQKLEVNGAVKTTSVQASGISTLSTCFMYGYLTEDNNSNRIYLNANELDFWTNGGSSLRITKATKNVLIGTTTDAGFKLDVNGDSRIKGSGNGNNTTALTIQNSDNNFILSARNDRKVWIFSNNSNTGLIVGDAFGLSTGTSIANNEIRFTPAGVIYHSTSAGNGANSGGVIITSTNTLNPTVNNPKDLAVGSTFAPTSGTGTYISAMINPIISQSGGANGITRGLYINPTLTAAADFRAIETTNGKVIFGGTGNVLIGTTTDAGFKLDVVGADARINGLRIGKGASQIANNTIIGANNGNSITTGSGNTFIGSYAGNANNSGAENVFIGISAGQTTSSSSNNTAVGSYALLSSNANSNSAFGWQAGTNSSSGNSNCFFGLNAGLNSTTGSVNIFLGVNSGRFVSDGTNNILVNNSVFLGSNSRALANNQTNQIVIGESAIGAGSNTATLGNTSIVDTILRGRVNIQQYATGSRPTYVKGALIYDSTLGKLVVGGNAGWEVVTSA